jgi:hypothetical protein
MCFVESVSDFWQVTVVFDKDMRLGLTAETDVINLKVILSTLSPEIASFEL